MTEPSQTELAELEMQFAKDPTSLVFLQLSTAYLQQGRFMEAMVVCKKGIKSQPESTEGRLLLARVYAEQGKIPKAVDEVKALLATKPDVPEAHFYLAQLHEKAGRFDDAIESYKDTLRRAPKHDAAALALKAKGVDFHVGPTPEEIAAAKGEEDRIRAEAEAAARAVREAEEAAARAAAMSVAPTTSATPALGQQRPNLGNRTPAQGMSRPRPMSLPPTVSPLAGDGSPPQSYGYDLAMEQQTRKRLGPGFTFGLGALLLLIVAGLVGGLVINKRHAEELSALWKAAQKGFVRDTTPGHLQAIEKLEAALKIDDGNPEIVSQLALSYQTLVFERGRKDLDAQAKAALERAQKIADEKGETVAAGMMRKRSAGDGAGALKLYTDYKAALSADQSPIGQARIEQGRAYATIGKIDEMVKIAEEVKALTDPATQTFLGDTFRRSGDYVRARFSLDGAMKLEAGTDVYDPGRALRALLILESGDVANFDVALDDVTKLFDAGKDAVGPRQRGYATLGRAYFNAKVPERAREADRDLAEARKLLPNDPEVPLFEAKLLLNQGKPKEAIAKLNEAIAIDKYRIGAYLAMIDAAQGLGDDATGDKAIADMKALFPDTLAVPLAEAEMLVRKRRQAEARTLLEATAKKYDVAEVYRDLGKIMMSSGDSAGAVEILKKAVDKAQSRPAAVKASVFTTLGRVLAAQEQYDDAIASYKEALQASASYAPAYYFVGVSLLAKGDNGAAKEAFKQYKKYEPSGAYAAKADDQLSKL